MEIEEYEHGVPSWVDLSAPDLPAARAFYGDLFGWDVPEGPPEAGGYSLALVRGKPVAGIGPQMNPDAPPAWMTYVNVDDADKVAAAVVSAGGQMLVPPMDVMDVGRMGILADPAGAVVGIWQPRTHKGALIVNEPNTLCWNELVTTDVPGATAFYASVFGWAAEPLGDPPAYYEWRLGGRTIGGLMAKPAEMPAEVPPHWGTYFAVVDTDRTVERIRELGGAVMMGPTDIEPGRFAVAADPAGATFNVIALKSAA
ncbi:MAG TPA: VOC family protein [Acidimicrobiales bacterium]|nr:VOC family protein [Acidimicrobiales bacterium]